MWKSFGKKNPKKWTVVNYDPSTFRDQVSWGSSPAATHLQWLSNSSQAIINGQCNTFPPLPLLVSSLRTYAPFPHKAGHHDLAYQSLHPHSEAAILHGFWVILWHSLLPNVRDTISRPLPMLISSPQWGVVFCCCKERTFFMGDMVDSRNKRGGMARNLSCICHYSVLWAQNNQFVKAAYFTVACPEPIQ